MSTNINRYKRFMFNFGLCLAIIALVGCSKKKTPLGNIPIPKIPDKVDLLPSLVNVKYHEGVSGVDSCKSCHSEIHSNGSSRYTLKRLIQRLSRSNLTIFHFKVAYPVMLHRHQTLIQIDQKLVVGRYTRGDLLVMPCSG